MTDGALSKLKDWNKNNKIAIRNFHESCDFHDIVKLTLMRMLRRSYPNSHSCQIYSEYNPEDPHANYPDIWMRVSAYKKKRLTHTVYVWEIQEKVSEEWKKQIVEKHQEVNLIIVPVKKIKDACGYPLEFNFRKFYEELERYVI